MLHTIEDSFDLDLIRSKCVCEYVREEIYIKRERGRKKEKKRARERDRDRERGGEEMSLF